MDKKSELCKKIRFIQGQLHPETKVMRYKYDFLCSLDYEKLKLIYDRMLGIRKEEIKNTDVYKLTEGITEILEEIEKVHYLEKNKCFIFLGEYVNTPIIELVKYEDEELWEYMISKEIEEKYGQYNVYILNVMRYTLYRIYTDGFESIRDMLRNPNAFDRYCDISFTLTVNFFCELLKTKDIYLQHRIISKMDKNIIEDFDKYVETNGV